MTRALARVALAVLLAPALAGCLAPGADVTTLAAIESDALGTYLHDLSEPTFDVDVATAVTEHVRVPAEGGVTLDTWVLRPDTDEKLPVVLEITPYYAGGAPVDATGASQLDFVAIGSVADLLLPRGYAVAVSSVRGTGHSGGCFTNGGPSEARDHAAVIEALAAMPWSNGNVGMLGVSYSGTTQFDAWVEAPPALKTIVPVAGEPDKYKYNFVNGVPVVVQGFGFNAYYWGFVGLNVGNGVGVPPPEDALDTAVAQAAGEACAEQLEVQEGGASSTLDGNKDAYWLPRDRLHELRASPPRERASVFYVHGFGDWNVKPHMMEDWIDAMWDSGVPMKAWLGQWWHTWPQREDWFEVALLAWLDQFLKGRDTGILDAPRVQVQDDQGAWRHEARWPPPDVEWRTLHLDRDARLSDAPGAGASSYSDRDASGPPNYLHRILDTPDAAPPRDVAVWESAPLAEDLHLAGQPVFEADVTATARRAALMLTLAERTEDGLRPIDYAAMSLNHAASVESGEPDVSGRTQRVVVRFFPQDDVVRAGSTLVLLAAGNLHYGDEWGGSFWLQPVGEGGTVTVSHEGATLRLPVDRTIVLEEPQPERPE